MQINLRFRGPKGGEFGQPIPIKLKINEPVKVVKLSQVELVKLAIKLFDAEGLGETYDEVIAIVTKFNGDLEQSRKYLVPRH